MFPFPTRSRSTAELLLLAALVCMQQFHSTTAYVNIKHGLPEPRKLEYLKQITGEICEKPTGELSDAEIADSHMVMKGWSTTAVRVSSKENAVAIENIVKRLVDEAEAGNSNANPTTKDYNCMLESWARSGEGVYAAERCEEILAQMQAEYESSLSTGVSPSQSTTSTSTTTTTTTTCAVPSQIRPNLSSFKIVLQAWKHAGGKKLSSFRAQRILDWMTTLYEEGRNDLAQPDQMCYDTVLQSWSRNGHEEAPVHAERLLAKMETMKLESKAIVPLVQPRTLSFNAVLGAWSRAPVTTQSSPSSPSSSSSSSSSSSTSQPQPSAFASQPSSTSWQRSCDILEFMEKLYYVEGNSMVEPDRVSYSLVLRTLARHRNDARAAQKADSILRFIEQKQKKGELSWRPDTLLFNTVMGCWSHSHIKGSYRKTRGILDRQIHMFKSSSSSSSTEQDESRTGSTPRIAINFSTNNDDCRPDIYGFTTVLSSCALEPGSDEDKAKAFNVARATYQQLVQHQEEYDSPNHVTYGIMLKCVSNLLPLHSPLRKKWTKKVFGQAVANGCVGGMVLSRLREAASSAKEYKSLMRGHTVKKLPAGWTRNVDEKGEQHHRHGQRRSYGKRAEV